MPHPVPLTAFVRHLVRASGCVVATSLVLACFALVIAAGCGPTDPAAARAAEVEAILEDHLEHEDALLDILERNQRTPAAAEDEVAAYLAEHGTAMDELCAKRRLLEADPTALAVAMRRLSPDMSRIFERRQVLTANAPELLAREKVRAALAALDAL